MAIEASRARHEKAESKRAKQEDRTRLKSVLSACNWQKETADPVLLRAAKGLWVGTETQGNADRDRAWGKEPRYCPEAGAYCTAYVPVCLLYAYVCMCMRTVLRVCLCAYCMCTCACACMVTVCVCVLSAPGDKQERCSKKRRMEVLQALCTNGFDGKPIAAMEKRWSISKRFKVARLAKASDMDSNFNPATFL